jgi:hypothetical protein
MKRKALVLVTLALACASASSSVPSKPELPATCPDLSGRYWYPGVHGLSELCQRDWHRSDLPYPGPGGFYVSAAEPHVLELRQVECRSLEVSTRTNYGEPGTVDQREDGPLMFQLDLEPSRETRVHWGDDSLTLWRKFTPTGFRRPFLRANFLLELRREPNGSLFYHLRHEERGKLRGKIRCTLPPTQEGR